MLCAKSHGPHGTLAPWHIGLMAHWPRGTLALWQIGLMAHWHYGTLASWHIGLMAHWTQCIGHLAHWLHGTLASWRIGHMGLWFYCAGPRSFFCVCYAPDLVGALTGIRLNSVSRWHHWFPRKYSQEGRALGDPGFVNADAILPDGMHKGIHWMSIHNNLKVWLWL